MAKIISLQLSDMEHEALMLMLKKANLTTDDILVSNVKRWVAGNMDLLNQKELEKFEPIFHQKNLKKIFS
ncbi:MAG: hypothetical protein RI894_1431 [Bacteroidota bacterium]|jgi:hypothetical protein